MKQKLLVLSFLLCATTTMYAQVSFGEAEKFNTDWLFSLSDDASAKEIKFDDSSWRKLTLPHDWSIEGQLSQDLASCTGYLPGGIAWYRKHFAVTDTHAKHYIYFEGVYNRSEVYLNGQLLGKRPNGYISFLYDMTPYLKDGENILAVRVDHSKYADSRWYTGSGIYRDVWLVNADKTHIAQWGLGYKATELTDANATVEVDVDVENEGKLDYTIRLALADKDGKVVAQSEGKTKTQKLSVKNPHRWNLNDPYLYTLKAEVVAGGKVVDKAETRVGLRTLQFDADKGFALNGKWMKVKGVCIHHDAGVLGSAVPKEVWRRRLVKFKTMGVNGIRMSHNPQAPDLYDLCDEMGFLVMDEGSDEWEFPKKKWIKGWNNGTPGYDGTFDFFEEWIDTDIRDIVRRDRNHPCVFLWSVGNEVDYPNDPYSHPILDGDGSKISQPVSGGYKKDAPRAERIGIIAKRLAAVIRSVDTSRPVTGALAGVLMSNQTEYPQAVDVVGYNYTESRYISDHKEYPKRIIYGSETSGNLAAWKAVKDNEHIFGHFIWTGLDYLGESGRWPSRGLNTGLIDLAGYPKPKAKFFESLWSEQPMAYIGTQSLRSNFGGFGGGNNNRRMNLSTDAWDTWNYQEGQQVRVLCYTNCPQARLKVNGKVVGEMKPYDEQTCIIYWDVDYEAGTVEVEGCDKAGKVIATYAIKTVGEAAALKAFVDKDGYEPTDKVVHVVMDVVDSNGERVVRARNEVTCTVEGGKLLGLEAANNSDMSDYTDNKHNVNRGRILSYIQKDNPKGKAKVTFSAEGFSPVTIEI
ncbi:MAG: DUF4982 domain-containing protein [Bacteroidaceae bacterium]|nr:DUF4982 domain-containing protein [Bacteroidaceae bacterium]